MLHTRPLISSTHLIHWFNCTCTLNGVALILLHPQFKKTPLPLLYHRIANNLNAVLCLSRLRSSGSTKLLLSLYNTPIRHKQAKSAIETLYLEFLCLCTSAPQHVCRVVSHLCTPVFFFFFKVHHRTDFTNKNICTHTHILFGTHTQYNPPKNNYSNVKIGLTSENQSNT